MQNLPKINSIKIKTKKYIHTFGGINRQESFAVGEMETSENVSFDLFPAISAGRKKVEPPVALDSAYTYIPTDGGLVAYKLSGTTLTLGYIEEAEKAALKKITTVEEAAEGKRYAARAGNYVVVFPDKYCLKLGGNYGGFKAFEKAVEIEDSAATISNGSIKFKTDTRYKNFSAAFKVGDVVTIDGGWYYGNYIGGDLEDKKVILRELDDDNLTAIFDPYSFNELQEDNLEMYESTFKLFVPDLKNLCSYEGRVWGNDEEGKIYASKYQDPTNYEYFDLGAADSFTIETETAGEFTASGALSDHIAFFKEDKIHRITGTKPSNFRHTVIFTNGVKKGAEKTLKEKDGTFYYVSGDGVYTYNGGTAQKISAELGPFRFGAGAAVFNKDVYYIGMKSETGGFWNLYGFDTQKRMWFRSENNFFEAGFRFLGASCFKMDGKYMAIGDGNDTTKDISVTLREITESGAEQKGWSRLYICARLQKGSRIKAEVDFGFGFETVGVFTDHRKTVFEIRLRPNRGDKIRLRLTASPDTVITKLMREYYQHNSVF